MRQLVTCLTLIHLGDRTRINASLLDCQTIYIIFSEAAAILKDMFLPIFNYCESRLILLNNLASLIMATFDSYSSLFVSDVAEKITQ
jgi:hypothetical protein